MALLAHCARLCNDADSLCNACRTIVRHCAPMCRKAGRLLEPILGLCQWFLSLLFNDAVWRCFARVLLLFWCWNSILRCKGIVQLVPVCMEALCRIVLRAQGIVQKLFSVTRWGASVALTAFALWVVCDYNITYNTSKTKYIRSQRNYSLTCIYGEI